MSLRLKLFAIFTLTVTVAVSVIVWGVERYAKRQFQESDRQHSAALIVQFKSELQQRGAEVSTGVQGIADAESTLRMVLELNRPQSDPSVYANDARGLSAPRHLDFLELVGDDGTLISSAQWPERIGYKNEWVTKATDWNQQPAFLDRVELPSRVELGLLAVRMVHVGDRNFYIVGGQRLGPEFLRSLAFPSGMRALLYRNFEEAFVPGALSDVNGPLTDAQPFAPIVASLRKQPAGMEQTAQWAPDQESAERFVNLPLNGRHGEFLGALLLGSAQGQLIALLNYVRSFGLMVAACGLFVGFVASWWLSARVTVPLAKLEAGIATVTAGDWDAEVQARATREVRHVLSAFNKMTRALIDVQSRQVTVERVAAWRDLAGHMAAEFAVSVAPMQIVIESLGQALQHKQNVSDVVAGSLTALQDELRVLQSLTRRLGEFALAPVVHPQAINFNDTVRAAIKSFEGHFRPLGRPPVTPELFLDTSLGSVSADPKLLQIVVESLLLRAISDMPAGGTITIRTRQQNGLVRMMMSDTGRGFELKCKSFSPYRTAGDFGTAMELAKVQAIMSDLGGTLTIESAPAAGTALYLDLPAATEAAYRRSSPIRKALPSTDAPKVGPELETISDPSAKAEVAILPSDTMNAQEGVWTGAISDAKPEEVVGDETPQGDPRQLEAVAQTVLELVPDALGDPVVEQTPAEVMEEELLKADLREYMQKAERDLPAGRNESTEVAVDTPMTVVPLEVAEDQVLSAEREEISESIIQALQDANEETQPESGAIESPSIEIGEQLLQPEASTEKETTTEQPTSSGDSGSNPSALPDSRSGLPVLTYNS